MNRGASTRAASICRPNRARSTWALTELETLPAVWTSAGQVLQVDGEAVSAQYGPPVTQGHALKRMENVVCGEIFEFLSHSSNRASTESAESDCTVTSPEGSSAWGLPVGCKAVCSSRVRAAIAPIARMEV